MPPLCTDATCPLPASSLASHVSSDSHCRPSAASPFIYASSPSPCAERCHGIELGSMNLSCPVPPLCNDATCPPPASSLDSHVSSDSHRRPSAASPFIYASSPSPCAELCHGIELGSKNSSCPVPPLCTDATSDQTTPPQVLSNKRKLQHLLSKKTTPLDLTTIDASPPRKLKIPRLASPSEPPTPPNPP